MLGAQPHIPQAKLPPPLTAPGPLLADWVHRTWALQSFSQPAAAGAEQEACNARAAPSKTYLADVDVCSCVSDVGIRRFQDNGVDHYSLEKRTKDFKKHHRPGREPGPLTSNQPCLPHRGVVRGKGGCDEPPKAGFLASSMRLELAEFHL